MTPTTRGSASSRQDDPRYSVVVPVHNEAGNIGHLLRAMKDQLAPDCEVIIVHDFEEDSTLAAIAQVPDDQKPFRLRTLLNTIGPGVRNAIEAGMKAATAPVVIVSMADLSDDYSAVDEMVSRAERGAAVVSASRYMKGGRQVGGPLIKGMMSRVAGLTLHWFAGLPTHDPTNSFRAYRSDFLERTEIESVAGFSLALELTVKAHAEGSRVDEVPATWRDRTSGTSRFRLFAWLPHYLRWYFWAFRHRPKRTRTP